MAPWCLLREERKEREGESEKEKERKKKHAYSLFSSSTDTLIVHITQTVTVLSCKTLNPGVEAIKVVSEKLTDTQTHSVHEREHFVYQRGLPVDINDRADISLPRHT